ncbi:MAG: endonuclease [Phycisphaerales bacterium]|nr:endonuclease [Phycisphaerales bacterium]
MTFDASLHRSDASLGRRIGLLALGLALAAPFSASADAIAPDLKGAPLRKYLRAHYAPKKSLDYKSARRAMFSKIDNKEGVVRLVYTGGRIETRDIPDHRVVNTEHTWPRSRFGRSRDAEKMKTDLHHLFPTANRVNSARGNSPFEEIPDEKTRRWWRSAKEERGIPKKDIDEYSESTPSAFEPREDHKGNVARAMVYFYVMYEERGIDTAWFRPQAETFKAWNKLDVVDDAERSRSGAIAEIQGNENPFVLDPTLVDRVLEKETTPEDKPAEKSAPTPKKNKRTEKGD